MENVRKISDKTIDKIESKLATVKWVGGLSLVVRSRTIMSCEKVEEVQVEKYIFDLGIKNEKGEDIGRLEVIYFYRPISVVKLGLIYVNPNFRNSDESYGKNIMINLQILIGDGIGILRDQTDAIWDLLDGRAVLLSQPYLSRFYENLGWFKLFPNEQKNSRARVKIFSKGRLSVNKILELQKYVTLGII